MKTTKEPGLTGAVIIVIIALALSIGVRYATITLIKIFQVGPLLIQVVVGVIWIISFELFLFAGWYFS